MTTTLESSVEEICRKRFQVNSLSQEQKEIADFLKGVVSNRIFYDSKVFTIEGALDHARTKHSDAEDEISKNQIGAFMDNLDFMLYVSRWYWGNEKRPGTDTHANIYVRGLAPSVQDIADNLGSWLPTLYEHKIEVFQPLTDALKLKNGTRNAAVRSESERLLSYGNKDIERIVRKQLDPYYDELKKDLDTALGEKNEQKIISAAQMLVDTGNLDLKRYAVLKLADCKHIKTEKVQSESGAKDVSSVILYKVNPDNSVTSESIPSAPWKKWAAGIGLTAAAALVAYFTFFSGNHDNQQEKDKASFYTQQK